ncbi:hypothetical protein RHSIM_Rhsim05G0050700 [Rhododendron simsii]|uniref:Uncharacterized protein n=1 Tax=Rhododendron simsii TaxID=118357 RepID=A0A834H201_RHOSS|nr:hypothetical protein RHSIM_Rhsim05G0050700 [Rhododendron simsii]
MLSNIGAFYRRSTPQCRNMRNARGAEPTLDQCALHPVKSSSKWNQRTQKRLPLPRPKTAAASPPPPPNPSTTTRVAGTSDLGKKWKERALNNQNRGVLHRQCSLCLYFREKKKKKKKRGMEGEVNREQEEEAQAHVDIWKYVFGFVDMAVVKCAIQLGISDALEAHGAPATLSDLSSTLGCSPSALHRIMRFLVHRKIFKEAPAGYLQTPLSRLLLKNGEKSLAALLLLESSPVSLAPWHCLSARVLANGSPAFEFADGEDVWGYAQENPGYSKLFNDGMACDATVAVPAIVEGCPEVFDGVESVVDVGGGDGTSLRLLVEAFPWIRGINFDLPHVVSVALDCVGVEHVGGDMFASVPKADAAYLKVSKLIFVCARASSMLEFLNMQWVLHDWDDDECIQILRKCREAIPKGKGKVIIVEAVVKEDNNDKLEYARLMLDMVMMAHTNKGKERTSKEWAYVLSESGFSRHTIKNIKTVQSVIEAYP